MEAKKKKSIKIIGMIIGILLVLGGLGYGAWKIIPPFLQYREAGSLWKEGKQAEAVRLYEELNRYRDSAGFVCTYQDSLRPDVWASGSYSELQNAAVGDTVQFGHFEQDADLSNGAEALEWKVADHTGDSMLLICTVGVDCRMYNEEYKVMTWEKSSLRAWLRDEFYYKAFTPEEQLLVRYTENVNPNNLKGRGGEGGLLTRFDDQDDSQNKGTRGGNNTFDHVFLLSFDEAKNYFASDEERICPPSAYAMAQGASMNTRNQSGWWWLRSPGYFGNCAMYVTNVGSIIENGRDVNLLSDMVRPALWIDLDS